MGPPEAIRAFWALELGSGARGWAAALARSLAGQPGGGDVRWVREESLHVTLRFLGSTDPSRIPPLVAAVGEATSGLAPFALGLGQLGLFPSARRPRVVSLSLEPETPLRRVADAVEAGVVRAGFEPESRPFRPHLTLGRARRGRRPAFDLEAVTASVTGVPQTWDVVESVLFRSELGPQGARYTALERVTLGGGPSGRAANATHDFKDPERPTKGTT